MAQEPSANRIIHQLEIESPLTIPIDDTLMAAIPSSVYTIETKMIEKNDLDYWLRWEGLEWIFTIIKTKWSRLIEKPNGDRIVIWHPRPHDGGCEFLNDAVWHMIKLLQLGDGSDNTEQVWKIVKTIPCPRCKLHYLLREYHTRVVEHDMCDTASEGDDTQDFRSEVEEVD